MDSNSVIYDPSLITHRIYAWLTTTFDPTTAIVLQLVMVGIFFFMFYAVVGLALVYAERKVCAFMQNRLGPNRVGPFGIFQTVADFIKLVTKEIIHIKRADPFLFNLAPFIVIVASFLTFSVIPYSKSLQVVDLNIGVMYVSAVSSLGVVGILIAGWASNNKYALIGAMRSGAQVISYELSVGLSLMTIVVMAGSMQLSEIIAAQANGWFIFTGHIPAVVAFIIFIVASTAEINRGPFDMAEAESELTAGYHTEYSGIKFAMFFLAEYINMFIVAAIAVTVFWGGWMPLHVSGWEGFNHIMDYIPSVLWFFGKLAVVIFIIMWFKWTFPRLRIDQLLELEWKYLLPISLVNILVMAVVVLMGWHF